MHDMEIGKVLKSNRNEKKTRESYGKTKFSAFRMGRSDIGQFMQREISLAMQEHTCESSVANVQNKQKY